MLQILQNKGNRITSAYQVCSELTLKEGFILTEAQEDEFKVGKFHLKVMPVWKWLLSERM